MATANTIHGKKVVVRKPKIGDMVVSRYNGKSYKVTGISDSTATIQSQAWRGLSKPVPLSAIATLAKRQ